MAPPPQELVFSDVERMREEDSVEDGPKDGELKKHKVDLELVLPDDAATCEACIQRLVELARAKPGILEAHIDGTDQEHPKLCLHYDPAIVGIGAVESLVKYAGAELKARFEHLSIEVRGLRHERHSRILAETMNKWSGVFHATVSFGGRRVNIEFDPSKTSRAQLLANIEKQGLREVKPGFPPEAPGPEREEHEHEHEGLFGEHSELIFSLTCGALTGIGWILDKSGLSSTGLFIVAYLLGSWFTLQDAFAAIRAKRFEIDFLMLLAAAGAAALGEWFEGALLLFLFTFGHALEGFAMRRARNAIDALAKLAPETALRLDESGSVREVGVEELAIDDQLLVKPNVRIPADGFVLAGMSGVNQAPITGESVPAEKQPVLDAEKAAAKPESVPAESRVFAGTINGSGALTIQVTKRAGESTLARVIKMVSEAEAQQSATQIFTDKFERLFVPIVLIGVIVLLFAWTVVDEPFNSSFYRAMAVLVAASPCALAIATPSAVLAGVARAARGGVLIKGGAHLESLGLVDVIAFDKTGTLTEGKPKLTDIFPTPGVSEDELLRFAVAIEKGSDHPLATAIVTGAEEKLRKDARLPDVSDIQAIIGFGVKGRIGGETVEIGKPGLFTHDGTLPEDVVRSVEGLLNSGRTVMIVKAGNRFLGAMGMMDTPRATARGVLARLHGLGVRQTIMLTGDHQKVGEEIGRQIGMSAVRGDLLPEQKVALVTELARSGRVAMVGDGVNDAPAMASATVGIAMGAGGSDVALETADVALMADDLEALPFAVGLSRTARKIIRQNLWMSLGMVVFLVPATIFDFARIGVAVSLHEGSTLVVVLNALRLLAYKDRG